jgi:predicted nuclease of restriction endonuclease-like (RecB) superfamily
MSPLAPPDYSVLLSEIKERVRSAQYAALKAVNAELIGLYWDIGRLIVERQGGEPWGKSVVENLSRDLRSAFPDVGGLSASNLWRMRSFYQTYAANEKLAPLVREIGWTHNLNIFTRCKDDQEREFYLRMTRRLGWTKNVLIQHLDNNTYERTLLNQTNFDQTVSVEIRTQAKLAVKDEYTFDFLELGAEYNERQLERALIEKIDAFLREMGGVFAFVGSQYRLQVSDREYFVDLVLYHRSRRCLVAMELKVGEFLPEYVGKLQFYLAVLNDTVKLPDENPSIGILLCRSKDRTIVEYALRESNAPVGVGAYNLVSTLPDNLKRQLPAPEQIAKLLSDIC